MAPKYIKALGGVESHFIARPTLSLLVPVTVLWVKQIYPKKNLRNNFIKCKYEGTMNAIP